MNYLLKSIYPLQMCWNLSINFPTTYVFVNSLVRIHALHVVELRQGDTRDIGMAI